PRMIGRRDVQDALHRENRSLPAQRVCHDDVARAFAADDRRRRRCRSSATATSSARAGRARQLADPREREVLHVRLIDLRERAVAAARVVAGVRGPVFGERLQQPRRIEAVARGGREHRGGGKERKEHKQWTPVAQPFRPAHGRGGSPKGLRYRSLATRLKDVSHFSVARYAVTLWMSVSEYVRSRSLCGCSGSWTSTFGVSPLTRN